MRYEAGHATFNKLHINSQSTRRSKSEETSTNDTASTMRLQAGVHDRLRGLDVHRSGESYLVSTSMLRKMASAHLLFDEVCTRCIWSREH